MWKTAIRGSGSGTEIKLRRDFADNVDIPVEVGNSRITYAVNNVDIPTVDNGDLWIRYAVNNVDNATGDGDFRIIYYAVNTVGRQFTDYIKYALSNVDVANSRII